MLGYCWENSIYLPLLTSSPAYSQEAIKTSDCTIWIYTWMGDICSIYDEWIMSGSEHDTDIWLIIPISTCRDYLPGSERHFEHKKTKEPEISVCRIVVVCMSWLVTVESFVIKKNNNPTLFTFALKCIVNWIVYTGLWSSSSALQPPTVSHLFAILFSPLIDAYLSVPLYLNSSNAKVEENTT